MEFDRFHFLILNLNLKMGEEEKKKSSIGRTLRDLSRRIRTGSMVCAIATEGLFFLNCVLSVKSIKFINTSNVTTSDDFLLQ